MEGVEVATPASRTPDSEGHQVVSQRWRCDLLGAVHQVPPLDLVRPVTKAQLLN